MLNIHLIIIIGITSASFWEVIKRKSGNLYMEFYKKNLDRQTSLYFQPKGIICSYCGRTSMTLFVHGHEQCFVCKINVEPCCQGEFSKSS